MQALIFLAVAAGSIVLQGRPIDSRSVRLYQQRGEIVLDGTLEVLVEDSDRGSRTAYFLISNARRVSLRFEKPPVNLSTGAHVRVRGRWDSDGTTLLVASIERIS